tara:strand:- start:783 stop:920 length:138 start_codon:yes stop_codon:yes gene_type:complete
MTDTIMVLIIVFMVVFAAWGQFYASNKNRNKILKNIERYEKEKIK